MTKIFRKKTLLVYFFFLSLFFAWANSALALPLLSVVMGNSHQVYLTFEHGEIHLNFCHHEKQDNNDLMANGFHEHEHNCSLNDPDVFSSEQTNLGHIDHEFHISSLTLESAATTNLTGVFKALIHPAASGWSLPESFDPASIKHSPQPFLETKSILFSLRKVVLLI